MTINELINQLEGLIAGNPHMANHEVRISAETADYGTIDKIQSYQNDKEINHYKATEEELEKVYPNYIYLTAQH